LGDIVLKKSLRISIGVFMGLVSFFAAISSYAVNEGLLSSQANLDAGITLTYVPEAMLNAGYDYHISWTPTNVQVKVKYSYNPGGGLVGNYPFTYPSSGTVGAAGTWTFDPSVLPAGYLYVMLTNTANTLTSVEFVIIRESTNAVSMIAPQSNTSSASGIPTTTPTFTWNSNQGVNYYHLVLSDQAFEIETDPETGELTTTGANIIWQVITPGTSIDYGQPDPSNFFNNINVPPLIGDLTGANRPTYNWVVLNNYNGTPATSSDVVGQLKAFEIAVAPPFASPVLLEPADGDVITSNTVIFEWTAIPQASSYHVYLTKEEIAPDSLSTVYTPMWYVQSTINAAECPVGNLLTSGNYRWKVIAEDNQGQGTMSMPSDFVYTTASGYREFYIRTSSNVNIQGAQIDFIPIEGPSLTAVLTDQNGYAERMMPYGTYIFELSKTGFVTTQTSPVTINTSTAAPLNFQMLQAASTAHGTVKDNQNNFIPFASVTAINSSTNQEYTTDTNNNGYYAFEVPPGTYQIQAAKTGYTASSSRTIALQPEQNVNVDNYGGPLLLTINLYTLDGHVTNPGGEPISLAVVTATSGATSYQYTTSDNGYYQINVNPGTWTLSASKPAFWLSSTLQPVQIINSGTTQNIILQPSANIVSGVVFKGAVLANNDAIVRAVPAAGQIEETTVNAQGNFQLSLSSGNYQLNAYLTGYTSPTPINLTLDVGQTISGVNIVLTPNPSYISGKITSDGVQAVVGATVASGSVTATTNAQGNYTLNVASGPQTVTASKTGYITAVSQQLNVAIGQTLSNINLTITPNAATINGTVRSSGQAVYQATVTARNTSNNAISTLQTSQSGTYTFGLSFGTYWLKASKSGMIAAAPESLQVVVNPGATVNNIDFNLIPNIGYISGSTLYNNQAVSSAQVTLVSTTNASVTFNTQSNYYGIFNVAVTPQHIYNITVSKTGYVPASATSTTIQPNTTQDFTFNLTQLQCQVTGKVYALPGNTFLVGATVTAVNTVNAATYTATTNNVGTYSLNLNAGAYNITASKAGYTPITQNTSLTAGQTLSNYHFYLQPNYAGLQGFIKNSSTQQAISNALVTVTEVNTQSGASIQTDATGYYSFTQLFGGSYNITVTHSQYQTGQVNGLGLVGGSSTTNNINLTPLNGSIAGNVRNFYNQGLSGASITAQRTTGGTYTAQTNSTGDYTISNLPSGTYNLTAVKTGYTVDDTLNVPLSAGQTKTGINFQIIANTGIIVGKVNSTMGVGLAGVQINASDGLGNFGSAATNSSGNYTLTDLFTQSQFTLTAVLSGYSVYTQPGTVQAKTTNPDSGNFVMLSNNLNISGTVVNQAGTVKSNIPVQAIVGSTTLNATTNTNGYYSITNAAPLTTYNVRTNAYSQTLNNASRDTTVGTISLTNVGLTMQEHSSTLTGYVRNNLNAPMVNVQVKAKRTTGTTIYTTNTGIDGDWSITNLFDGTWKIWSSKIGYSVAPDTITVPLAVGQTQSNQNFTMTEIKISISGTVRNNAGQPMSNVEVKAWTSQGTDSVYTNSSGVYTFADKTANINYQISTDLPPEQYQNAMINLAAGISNVTGQDLTVTVHNASITAQIEDLEGNPLSGVTIGLLGAAPLVYDTVLVTSGSSFDFDYLYAGNYTLSVDKSGYVHYETPIILTMSQNLDLGTIELQAVTNAVYGVITNGIENLTIRNVVVNITNVNTSQIISDTSSNAGAYQISGLNTVGPNNIYNIRMVKEGFPDSVSANFTLTASTEKNYTLTPYPNSIYGSVRNEAGIGKANAIVQANKFGAAVFYDTTNYFGDYSFNPLSSGNYQLHAWESPPGVLDSYYDNVTLTSGGSSRKILTVLSTGKIYGTVTYNGQIAPGAASVTAYNTISQNLFTQQTGSGDSSFYFSGLRANPFSVTAAIEGFEVLNSPQLLTPTLGETDTIEFFLHGAQNALSGFVLDSTNSAPIAEAQVYLYQAGELDTSSTITSSNGSFSFGSLDDGNFTVWTEKSGYNTTALSSASLPIGGNVPQQQDLWLRSIPGSISGQAIYVTTSGGLSGAEITLTKDDATYDSTIVTLSDGNFLFTELTPGTYELTAAKAGFTVQPESYLIGLAINQSIGNRDFYFSADVDSFDISGYVTHGIAAVQSASVICRSLLFPTRVDTLVTNGAGYYRFIDWPAPDQVQLRVYKAGFTEQVSPPLDLASGDLQQDFDFPAGQFKFFVTSDGVEPLANVQITVYNQNLGVNLTLTSDTTGTAETTDNLLGSDLWPEPYSITVTHYIPGYLTLQTYSIAISYNEVFSDTIILGIDYTAAVSAQIESPVSVTAQIANDLVNHPQGFNLDLFYKGVGRTTYDQVVMNPPSANSNAGIQLPIVPPAGGNSTRGNFSDPPTVIPDDPPVVSGGGNPPAGGWDQGFATYVGVIPGQSASGTVEYYLYATAGDRDYSNFSQQGSLAITSTGVLAILQLQPLAGSLQWNYPMTLSIQTFDDGYASLNDSLSAASVEWSYADTTNTIGTLTPVYSPTAVDSAALSAVYLGSDTGTVSIMVQVTKGAVTLAQIASITVENRVLDSLSISDNIPESVISNTDSVIFTVSAYDIDGATMSVIPIWSHTPQALGTLTPTAQNKVKFTPYPGLVGQVFFTVTDSITGISASYNNLALNVSDRGLLISQNVTNDISVTINDSAGFELSIPQGAIPSGNTGTVTLKRPAVPQVKKNSRAYEIHADSYQLTNTVEFSPEVTGGDLPLSLTLPIPEETRRLNAVIGRWDEETLGWENLGGTVDASGNFIDADIFGFSEYVVMGVSKPLGIEDLEFHPNPFSPSTVKKLQIEFTLNSQNDATPEVTVKIFNMRGDLVRTIIERAPMPKGPHLYSSGVFQQGVEDGSIEWDGLTEDGLLARNGRYAAYIKVEDPTGSKEEIGAIVLVK